MKDANVKPGSKDLAKRLYAQVKQIMNVAEDLGTNDLSQVAHILMLDKLDKILQKK